MQGIPGLVRELLRLHDDLGGEGADSRLVARRQPPHERLGTGAHQPVGGAHAATLVEHDDDGDGLILGGEERQRPDLAVFADLEVVAGQVGDEFGVVFVDGRIDGDSLCAAAEGWLLLVLVRVSSSASPAFAKATAVHPTPDAAGRRKPRGRKDQRPNCGRKQNETDTGRKTEKCTRAHGILERWQGGISMIARLAAGPLTVVRGPRSRRAAQGRGVKELGQSCLRRLRPGCFQMPADQRTSGPRGLRTTDYGPQNKNRTCNWNILGGFRCWPARAGRAGTFPWRYHQLPRRRRSACQCRRRS